MGRVLATAVCYYAEQKRAPFFAEGYNNDMSCRAAIIVFALIFGTSVAHAEQHALTFVKRIGGGWGNGWGWMSFVSFSPDGTEIAADAPASPSDMSGHLTLWSFPGGRLLKQLPGRPDAISPDWKYYAGSNGVGALTTGKVVISVPHTGYALYAFGPSSRLVAESSSDSSGTAARIRVFALDSAKQVIAFSRLQPSAIAISPNGITLASGHWQEIKLWNLRTGERIAVLRGFHRYVDGISFSKNGGLLAAEDGSDVQVWNVRSRKLVRTIKAVSYESIPVFSPDTRFIAVGAYGEGTVSLIDIGRGRVIDSERVSDLGCGSAAFSPNGRYLITPSTGGLITWPYDVGGTIRVFRIRKRWRMG